MSAGNVIMYPTWVADVRAELESLGHPVHLTTSGPRLGIVTTVEGAQAIGRGPYVDPLPEPADDTTNPETSETPADAGAATDETDQPGADDGGSDDSKTGAARTRKKG